MLQKAAGVAVNGLIGPGTLRAAIPSSPTALIDDLGDVRRRFYEALAERDPSQGRFLKGWVNRVAATAIEAHATR